MKFKKWQIELIIRLEKWHKIDDNIGWCIIKP